MNPLHNAPHNTDDIAITSRKYSDEETDYKAKIHGLTRMHGLRFDLNPGGGVFYNNRRGLQVSATSFEDDYNHLVEWLNTAVD